LQIILVGYNFCRPEDENLLRKPIPFHLMTPYSYIENVKNRSKEQLKSHLKHPDGFITTVNKNSKRKGKQQVTENIPTQNFQEYYSKSKAFQGEIEKFFIKLHYKLNVSKEYLN